MVEIELFVVNVCSFYNIIMVLGNNVTNFHDDNNSSNDVLVDCKCSYRRITSISLDNQFKWNLSSCMDTQSYEVTRVFKRKYHDI